jgi:hypothetical protein
MSLILSIFAGLLGSLFGSAARAGITVAQARVDGKPGPDTLSISGSPVAGLVGGVVGAVAGTRTAFWMGAVLGAAGTDRFDAFLLKRVGIDMDALVAKANEAAQSAAADLAEAAEQKAAEMTESAEAAAEDASAATKEAVEDASAATKEAVEEAG